jgi:hypothetical protein
MEGTSMIGSILWAGDYGDHPESAKVRLLANGAEINSVDVTEDEDGIWGFGFYDLPENDADGNKIAYSLTADPVEGYHIVTFDRNGTGAIAFMYVLNSRFAEKPADPIPLEGESFVGWYSVEGNSLGDLFDFDTRVTEDIVLKAFFNDAGGAATSVREVRLDGASIAMEYDDDNASIGAMLTQEEMESDYGIYVVSSSGDGMSQSDKDALLALAERIGATPVEFFQTSLYKMRDIWWGDVTEKLSSGSAEKLDKISSRIRMAVDVPQIMEKHGRTYYLLQCQDGKAEVVAQGKDAELMWESDEFSGYMLAYSDPPAPAGNVVLHYTAIIATVLLSLILIGSAIRRKL